MGFRSFIAAVTGIALLPAFAGCANPTPDALKQVSSASEDYQNQNYRAAETKLTAFLKKYPNAPESAEAYYLRSLCGTRGNNRMLAEADARQCIKLAAKPELAANCHATLAALLYEADRTEEALGHFETALKSLPEKPPADLLRLRYGMSLQREGRWQDSRAQLTRVCQAYPGSDVATQAKRLLDWPHTFYAIQCGAFRDKKAAASQEQKLKLAGHAAWTEPRSRSGEVLYTVYVGKYARYSSAREAQPRVQRTIPGAHIVP